MSNWLPYLVRCDGALIRYSGKLARVPKSCIVEFDGVTGCICTRIGELDLEVSALSLTGEIELELYDHGSFKWAFTAMEVGTLTLEAYDATGDPAPGLCEGDLLGTDEYDLNIYLYTGDPRDLIFGDCVTIPTSPGKWRLAVTATRIGSPGDHNLVYLSDDFDWDWLCCGTVESEANTLSGCFTDSPTCGMVFATEGTANVGF